jgi:tetratricopeptide (TPR) repeat protein
MGQLYELKGDVREAKNAYRRAVQVSPRHIRSLEALMAIYESQKKEKKVLQTLKTISKLTPRDTDRHLQLGRLALKLGQRHTGREALRKAIQLDPDNHPMVIDAVGIMIDSGIVREAERIIDEYARKNPDDPEFITSLGDLYMKKNKLNKARDFYMKSLEIQKKDPSVHFSLAKVYIGTGIKRLARDHLETALRLRPDFSEAHSALGNLDQLIRQARQGAGNNSSSA